ncbi:MAG: HAD family hydrolase [Streptosporangiaceae bacterium]
MSLEAVVFDWGGTLTPWHDIDVRDTWRRIASSVDLERAEEIAETLFDAERAAWRRAGHEHRSFTLDEVLAEAGVTPSEAVLAACYDAWEPHTFTDPEAPALLANLRRRGIRIGVLSNTAWSREWHERVFSRDGVLGLIHGAVYTSEIPWVKPHPEAFRAALAAVGVADPASCVFVGDRPYDDIHGARSFGMRAVLVPNSAVPSYDGAEPDAVIGRLSELLPLIDSWRGSPDAPNR